MKTKTAYILAAFFVVTILGSGAAFAERSFMRVLEGIDGIDLTEAQREKLENAEIDHRKKMIRFRADLSIAELEEHTLMKNKDFDKAAVQEQIKKIGTVKTGMRMARLDNHDLLRQVLTDDQWKQFMGALRAGKGRHGGRKHFGGGMGFERHFGKRMNCPFAGKGLKMSAEDAFRGNVN